MLTRHVWKLFALALALSLPAFQADATSMSGLRLEWDYNGTTRAWIGPDDPEILVMNVVIRASEPEVLSAYVTILYDNELDFVGSSDNISQYSQHGQHGRHGQHGQHGQHGRHGRHGQHGESSASTQGQLDIWDVPATITGGAITIGTIAFRTSLDTAAFDERDLFVAESLLLMGAEGPLSIVVHGSAKQYSRYGVSAELPEPSTATLLLGGVGLMLWGARGRSDSPDS